ncbi:MAG: polysaccharide deacetylase [Roseburia sp.]|nr:polysaccharide deacetylase [Roseburia sp.]
MQEKESEALRNQRRRRKRIGRMKSMIVLTVTGWMILSMILIVFLLARTVSLERRLDRLLASESWNQVPATESEEISSMQEGTEAKEDAQEENQTPPQVSGMEDADNLAEAGDVHKVYLTFDDGPSENTAAILDILAEYDIKATFFVVGREDEESKALYQRIVDEGHTLGMHSYSNKYSIIYQSEEAFAEDYDKLRDYLYEVTGTECRYYRFPGGSSNQISNVPMSSLIDFLNEQGTVYCDWNVSAGDAASTAYTPEEIVANVTEDVVKYKTSVVLLHDSSDKSATVEAIRPLIEALQEMDAEILPIDEDTQVIQYVKADSAR